MIDKYQLAFLIVKELFELLDRSKNIEKDLEKLHQQVKNLREKEERIAAGDLSHLDN